MRKNKMKSQVYRVAAFPLNIIVLPGEEVPLRIFEPRYKQLVDECLESKLPFGIPYMNEGKLTGIGSEVEITKVIGRNKNQDMVIMIKGKSIFNLIDFIPELPSKLYGGGVVEIMNNDFSTTNPDITVIVKALRLNLRNDLGTLVISEDHNMLDIARTLMMKSEEKYKFLTLKNKESKEHFLLNQLRFLEIIRSQESKLENNFQLN